MFLKSNILKAISFRNPVKLPLTYWVLVFIRFALTLLPQLGYLHPDEFFQNVEVMAGDIFTIDVAKTWEFNPKFPIRNIFVPKMIVSPPLHLIRLVNPYTKYYLNIDLKTPYYLLVIPRLFICLLSFINDYSLYKICVLFGQNFKNRLIVFGSSYIVLVYCCRSFSNTFEMIFFSILLLIVAKCMLASDEKNHHDEFLRDKYEKAATPVEKVKLFKLKMHLPEHSLNHVALLATVVVIGIFNRPTFVGFAFPPIFFWLQRGLGSKVVGFNDIHVRIFTFLICGVPTALLLILVDSGYYGYLTMAEIESMKWSWGNWVVTPLNFLRYNSDTKNLMQHCLHPRWMHLVVNVPLLFNVLAGMAFITLLSVVWVMVHRFIRGHYGKLPRIQSITGLMVSSLVIPVALLSLFPHQEARFIIPVLVPLVYLYGNRLHPNESDSSGQKKLKNILLYTWFVLNAVLTLFYGFMHQGGIYPFVNTLHREIKATYGVNTFVFCTHAYSIPAYLLQLESTNKVYKDRKTGILYKLNPTTFFYEYGSLPMDQLFKRIDDVLTGAEMLLHEKNRPYRFYVATPCSLEADMEEAATQYYNFKLIEDFRYYPHYCTEAVPKFPGRRDQYCLESNIVKANSSSVVDLSMLQRISCYLKRFCLKVYRVKASYTSNIRIGR